MTTESKKPASFWMRFVAVILDSIFLTIIDNIILFILSVVAGVGVDAEVASGSFISSVEKDLDFYDILGILEIIIANLDYSVLVIVIVIWTSYHILLTSSKIKGTFGKALIGIQVIDENGKRISLLRSSGRYLASFISSILLCMGYLIAAFRKDKKALHDIIAGTQVIIKK